MSKKFKLFLLFSLSLTTQINNSYAQCARDDIDYYLNKGFTPEQITKICTTPPLKSDKPASDITNNFSRQSAHDKNESFLKEVIRGRNVILSKDALQYTLKICIEYGDEDLYGFAPTACPNVRFVIARKGLEVISSRKKYLLFGADEIKIKGTIKREILDGLEKNTDNERELINQLLESGDNTIIPVRDDVPLDSVEQVLLQLSMK